MSVNKAILMGRLGQDPKLEYTQSKMAVCKFSLATSRKWKSKDGRQNEATQWHSITAWGGLAEVCSKFLKKGSPVYVEGEIQYQKWTDKKTGLERYRTDILAETVDFLSTGPKEPQQGSLGEYDPNFADGDVTL